MKTAVNNALADKTPCVVATASSDGKPGIGLRGSVMAYGNDSLAYWERTFRQGSENIESNPHIAILYRNSATRQSWKFFGQAEVHRDDDVREDVLLLPSCDTVQGDTKESGNAARCRPLVMR